MRYFKNYKCTSPSQYKAWRRITTAYKAFPAGQTPQCSAYSEQRRSSSSCCWHLSGIVREWSVPGSTEGEIVCYTYKDKYFSDGKRVPSLESEEPSKAIQVKKQILERCTMKKRTIFISYTPAAMGNPSRSLAFLLLTLPHYHYCK